MSKMKAKHYQLIAIALSGTRPEFWAETEVQDQWERDCGAIAAALAQENPDKFDRSRFLLLCGVLQ